MDDDERARIQAALHVLAAKMDLLEEELRLSRAARLDEEQRITEELRRLRAARVAGQ